MKTGEITVKM